MATPMELNAAESELLAPGTSPRRRQPFFRWANGRVAACRIQCWQMASLGRDCRRLECESTCPRLPDPRLAHRVSKGRRLAAKDVVVLNQRAFEQWFRDTPALLEKVEEWIGGTSAHLPLAGNGADRLAERARTDSRLRRVLFSIQARGHLAEVSVEKVRQHVRAQGLNPAKFVKGNQLVFDDAEPATLLKILNEDLFRGGLTNEPFVADRKAPRWRTPLARLER